ncbi:hypothetical protein DNTS_018965 [Danionella cerebrum]|uniref:Uncharacterized protein n=1 Tax=Danionella cerebrum TaxID=2873325 RepID=A0A553QPT3_9TELE|nr:hypothetical protein DNTS_018965 [Danionella translucida]
MQLFTPAT